MTKRQRFFIVLIVSYFGALWFFNGFSVASFTMEQVLFNILYTILAVLPELLIPYMEPLLFWKNNPKIIFFERLVVIVLIVFLIYFLKTAVDYYMVKNSIHDSQIYDTFLVLIFRPILYFFQIIGELADAINNDRGEV